MPPQVIGIPTLAVTAAPWLEVAQHVPNLRICAYMQAGRGRYNWAWVTQPDLLRGLTVEDHTTGDVEAFAGALRSVQESSVQESNIWLVGEPTQELSQAVQSLTHVVCLSETSAWRRAGHLAHIAALHLAAGKIDSVESLQPLYLRAP